MNRLPRFLHRRIPLVAGLVLAAPSLRAAEPPDPDELVEDALAARAAGDDERAATLLADALTFERDHIGANFAYGQLHLEAGRIGLANVYLCVAHAADDPDVTAAITPWFNTYGLSCDATPRAFRPHSEAHRLSQPPPL